MGYDSPLAEEINITSEGGKLVALIGRNGKGKSTLLKTIAGNLSPLKGSVMYNGISIHKMDIGALSKVISMVSTNELVVRNISAKSYIAFGRYPYTNWLGMNSDLDEAKINEAIELCDVASLIDRSYDQLSDGERQRINIARAIAQDTPIILLDEPTSHLDLIQRLEILKLLKHLVNEKQKLILFSTHNIEHALQLADDVWLVDNEVHAYPPNELAQNANFQRLFSNNNVLFDPVSLTFKFK